jgi:hypothetical protein
MLQLISQGIWLSTNPEPTGQVPETSRRNEFGAGRDKFPKQVRDRSTQPAPVNGIQGISTKDGDNLDEIIYLEKRFNDLDHFMKSVAIGGIRGQ